MRALREAREDELPAAIELRHELHANPEASGSEWDTSARVSRAIGLSGTVVAGTGRVIRVGRDDGPSVAVRAELDALPIAEASDSPYAAANGLMHACGHDVHLAALAGLVRGAARVELPVPLVAVLQPREEGPPSGARDIVGEKVLHRNDVRAVVAAHVQPLLPRGQAAATPGAVNAAADQFEIVVTGRGGHGGYPHLTDDPVVALAQVVVALQQVVSRRIDPLHPTVLTIGSLQAGTAPNVIPDRARATGTLRALEEDDRARLHEEIARVVAGVAAALGCHGEVRVHEGEPALVNDAGLARHAERHLEQLAFRSASELRSCGADDFAYYGDVAPSLMMFVGVGDGSGPGLHHAAFDPGDAAVGDVALALLAGYQAGADLVEAVPGPRRQS